jgi:transcriptional regulator with XRE-family HTH domain
MTDLPIDWRAVVNEAIRRRKEEGLSQRDLAALAGVSAPTVNAFEKGQINLRLDRVAAILDSLGLFLAPGGPGGLEAFIQSARRRWQELTSDLPPEHPSRQPFGHSEQAYALGGVPSETTLAGLRDILSRAPRTSGWTPFWVPTRAAIRPTISEGGVECWLGRPETDRAFEDAAHSDFWRVGPEGNAYLQRGYQEDGPDLEAGTIFDVTLPVWRTAEVLLHAVWLARERGAAADTKIRYFARYTGLAGRRLFSWAKPLLGVGLGLSESHRARTDSVDLSIDTTVQEIEHELEMVTEAILLPLFERFDGYVPPREIFSGRIEELRRSFARIRVARATGKTGGERKS